MNVFEFYVLAALFCLVGAGWLVRANSRIVKSLKNHRDIIWEKRWPIGFLVFSFAFVLAALPTIITGGLPPQIHDEFSYLLQADTLLHGRLANPPHPFASSFESYHVLSTPTYASKYPLGQGAFLAIGQLIFGSPMCGVWLSSALAVLIVYACSLVFGSVFFTAFATLFAASRICLSYWSNSYWGGSVACIGGGLLLFGALLFYKRGRAIHGCLAGLGVAILVHTRPFEGALFVLALLPAGIVSLRKHSLQAVLRFLAVAAIPAFCGVLLLLMHNKAVTGDFLQLPHKLYSELYMGTQHFVWDQKHPPKLEAAPDIKGFFATENVVGIEHLSRAPFLRGVLEKLEASYLSFFFKIYPTWLIVLLMIFVLGRSHWIAWVPLLAIILGNAVYAAYGFSHYYAPFSVYTFLCITFVVVTAAKKIAGKNRWIFLLVLLGLLISEDVFFLNMEIQRKQHHFMMRRQVLLENLEKEPFQSLVFVEYEDDYKREFDWIYNSADIDSQKIVWARALDLQRDQNLANYYPARKVLLARVGNKGVNVRLLREADWSNRGN